MNHSSFSPQIKLSSLITSLDWIVFTLILLITFISVYYGQRKKEQQKHSKEENFLCGRGITLIKALCENFEYHKPGNKSTSTYIWFTDNSDT